jgi:hypothetical protein
MNMRHKVLMNAAIIAGILIFAGWAAPQTGNQAAGSSGQESIAADQQNQLGQLQQLEGQLQKDRTAVHEAIGEFGFDSAQVSAARAQLLRDRTQYRQLRRSLVAAGVAVPAASGLGFGRSVARQGRMGPRCRGMAMRGRGMGPRGNQLGWLRGGGCQCPCGRR